MVVVVRYRSSFGAPTSSYSTTMMLTYYYLEVMNLSLFLSVSLLLGTVYVSVSVYVSVCVGFESTYYVYSGTLTLEEDDISISSSNCR